MGLVASDATGSTTMPVTFVVSTNTGPRLGLSVADQLSAHNGFSSPDSLMLPHSTALSLSFSSGTFTNTDGNTLYYAICANNTPLPSWLTFNPSDLSFTGTAPSATAFVELPTTYSIDMIASDVAGFAGAVATFSIVVSSHLFAFGSSLQIINATVDSPFSFSGLLNNLALNGQPVNSSEISSASAAMPSWLSLDTKTLMLSGIPPNGALPRNITVNATDIYGDMASTTVWIQTPSENSTTKLLGPVAPLTVEDGQHFVYDLNRTLTNKSASVDVNFGDACNWLTFDFSMLELKGQVPSSPTPQQCRVNVTASLGSQSQSQELVIQMQTSQTSAATSGRAENPTGLQPIGDSSSAAASSGDGLLRDSRWIALPVALPIAVILTTLLVYFCCYKRRKREATYDCSYSKNSSEDQVSPPTQREKTPAAAEEAAIMSGALHSGSRRSSARISKPPIIDIPGFWKSYSNKRRSQFRTSQISADDGGRNSRADSWHRYTANFNVRPQSTIVEGTGVASASEKPHKTGQAARYKLHPDFPHFSVSSRSSPTHDYSRSRQARSKVSFGSSAMLSAGTSDLGLGHGRSIPSQGSGGIIFGTRGIGHGDGGGPPGYGTVRDSWRNFRFMHLRSIDGRSSSEGEAVGRIAPTHRPARSDSPDKYSIRRVRSHSYHRQRSSDLHRRSTIQTHSTVNSKKSAYRHHLYEPPIDPLQEFHRRRVLLKNTSRARFAAGPSESSYRSTSHNNSLPRPPSRSRLAQRNSIGILPTTPEHHARHHRERRHTHSESSGSSAISTLHSSPSKAYRISPNRSSYLRHNTNSTSIGVRLPLIGRRGSRKGSIMSDDQDSRWESASSDAQSMDPYIYSREVNNGHRETSLFDTQQKQVESGVERTPSVYGVERFARGLKGLSWQRAEREGNHSDDEEEVGRSKRRVRIGGEEKGKVLAKSAGMPKGEPGNLSFKGEIRGLDDDGASAFV